MTDRIEINRETLNALLMIESRFPGETFVAPLYGPTFNQRSVLRVTSIDHATGELKCLCAAGENYGITTTEHVNFVRVLSRDELNPAFTYWDNVQGVNRRSNRKGN